MIEEIARKRYSLVIASVCHLEGAESYFNESGEMDYEKAKPLAVMLGNKGMWFTSPVTSGRYADYSEMFQGKQKQLSPG